MNITLHLPTAVLTIALGGLTLVGTSAKAPQGPTPDRDVQTFEDIATPRVTDYIRVASGTPFTVPPGQVAVIRSLWISEFSDPCGTSDLSLRIDGTVILARYFEKVCSSGTSYAYEIGGATIDPGVIAHSGSTITVTSTNDIQEGVAIGYLADA